MGIELIGGLIIGLTLGLLGSGGSALTVPVLVYLVGHGPKQSIAESMAIVGLISVAAAIPYARAKLVDWRNVGYFGGPGMLGTFIGAWLGGLSSDAIQLAVFGGVLILAAYAMLKRPRLGDKSTQFHQSPIWKIALEGTVVGVVTGFVGVGGGFLVVPALVVLGRLPIRLAIGTSLVIIAFKAAIGFAKYQHYLLAHDSTVNVATIAVFVFIGVVGSFIGKSLNARLNQPKLKHLFAVLLIILGGFVIVQEGSKLVLSGAVETTALTIQRQTSSEASLSIHD